MSELTQKTINFLKQEFEISERYQSIDEISKDLCAGKSIAMLEARQGRVYFYKPLGIEDYSLKKGSENRFINGYVHIIGSIQDSVPEKFIGEKFNDMGCCFYITEDMFKKDYGKKTFFKVPKEILENKIMKFLEYATSL